MNLTNSPFNTDGSQSQDRANGHHTLYIMNRLTHEKPHRPGVREQLGHLKPIILYLNQFLRLLQT